MKIVKLPIIYHVFLIMLLSSCNAQTTSNNKQDKSTIPDTATQIGVVVSVMDGSPNIVFHDKQNNYWFGVKERGMYKYNENGLVLYSKKDGLCSNDILGIQEDTLGNIYFDTFNGVCKYDGQKFTTLEVVHIDSTKNEWKLEPGDLWFRMGWNSNGPYRYDGNALYQLEFPKTEQEDKFNAEYPNVSFNPYGIYFLYTDSKGVAWFGTSSLGVCRYDGKSIRWLYEEHLTTTPGGGAFGIRSILEDKDGYFWFTNSRYRYDILAGNSEENGSSHINYRKLKGVGYSNENGEVDFPYFMSVVEDNDGDLWMATYDEGIWRNDGKQLIHYPIKDGDKDVLVFSLYKDNHGILWLVTHNAGVYKYNGRNFEKFELKNIVIKH